MEIHGELPQVDVEYARRQAHTLLAQLAPGAYAARLRLTRARNRAVTRPVIAQAGLLLEGVGPVRVQLSAVTAREAVDLTLGTVLGRAARLREQGNIGLAVAYESAYRPQFAPRPLTERRIVRRKPVALAALTPEQAVREMLALDHHFHLFTDADTGQDSLVHRQPATGGFRLVRADSTACPDGSGLPLSESLHPAPRFDVTEAARRLWLTCWPFVFFVDASAAPGPHAAPGAHAPRGQVLYRRYDGHYGLITAV
ncbi:sigma 54 modulation/S30EA ribosomal C-terminal domain-containing protein [Kitasatospora sp. NPDC004240]